MFSDSSFPSTSSEDWKKPEKSEEVPPSTTSFNAPLCTMCSEPRRNKAKSCCITCQSYLCDRCDFTHRMMIIFDKHHIEPLNCAKYPYKKWSDADGTEFTSASNGPTNSKRSEFNNVQKLIENLLEISTGMNNMLVNLGYGKGFIFGELNKVCDIQEGRLRMRRTAVVGYLELFFNALEEMVATQKAMVDKQVQIMCNKLNLFSFLDLKEEQEEASGFDWNRLFNDDSSDLFNGFNANTSASNSSIPAAWKNFDFEGLTSDAASGTSVLSTISYPLTFSYDNEPSPNYAIPNELLNLPVVASNFNESKSSPTPDLSTTDPDNIPQIKSNTNSMQLVKMFGQKGTGSSQFNAPHGICLGRNEEIVVADSSNHRIQIFDKMGCFKRMFGIAGRHDGHMWHPRKVVFLPTQKRYVVCDRGYERSRMQLFSEDGKFFKKINIHFIDIVAGITVTDKEEIAVVDSVTPTVFIIGPNEFLRSLDCSDFMLEPSDIAVYGGHFYICDFKGHKIVVVDEDGRLLRQFGTKYTTNFPNGIAISSNGDVVVGDSHGNFYHVVVYTSTGDFIAEYRCYNVKVSRCCGLQLSSEGHIITVDKNYHRVIVLDTLYLPRGFY